MTEPDLILLREQNARMQERLKEFESKRTGNDGNGGDTYMPDMNERLAKVEGVVGGLERTQEFTIIAVLGVGAILAAFVIGFGVYSLQRIDTLNDKVTALPGQINSELRDITKTLAESITAAKQQNPQVILMPTPQAPSNQK